MSQGHKRGCHNGKTVLAEHADVNKKACGNFSHHTALWYLKSLGKVTEQQRVKLNLVNLQLPYLIPLPPSKNETKQKKPLTEQPNKKGN